MSRNPIWAIVPAAGTGKRMGGDIPKQYLPLLGHPIIEHTLRRLLAIESLCGIVVPLAADDTRWRTLPLADDPRIVALVGGAERCHSVLAGVDYLHQLAEADDWVLVHDVARPCVRIDEIDRLIESLADHPVGGILGSPVRDTMKRTDISGNILHTVDRDQLWHALTPQLFRLGVLRQSLRKALERGVIVTDEAAAVEQAGSIPRVIAGSADNIKITVAADLALAEQILQYQMSERHTAGDADGEKR